MKVTILGNSSALPAYGRFPTAQIVNIDEQLFLVDCGEGTQIRLQEYAIRKNRIHHIFISHMHGDHYFGLVGLISSFSLLGRQADLHLYAPAELQPILSLQLAWELGFTLHFHPIELAYRGVLVDTEKIQISTFPVFHSIPTQGFLFVEKKRKRKLLDEKLREYEIPTYFYKRLAEGEDYTNKAGDTIPNALLTKEGDTPKSYAYCADTIYNPAIIDDIRHVSMLYHEATYLSDNQDKATSRYHSTAAQAAHIAHAANVGKLIIGHFSSKYKDLEPFLTEAQSFFSPTSLALEGNVFDV